jgi:F-type H+-transporting ATPase subunit epsilon
MAHPSFDFQVITPEGSRLRRAVTALRLPGRGGSFGVLARHAPLLAALEAGRLGVTDEAGKRERFAVGDGFLEVGDSGVRALVDFCEPKEAIDVERAERAERRARERLKARDSKVDFVRAEAALRRALARLSVAKYEGLD